MAKRNKSGQIPVEVIELKSKSENDVVFEVRVKDVPVGTVAQSEEDKALVVFKSGRKQTVSTVDEGIEEILRDYNLHS